MADEFAGRLKTAQETVVATLAALLPEAPARLAEAMRYAVLAPGKRLRPFVVIETARLFGKEGAGVARVAAAVECIHCYSLVHDDLPAMDDDDVRRGQPTVHKAFDEATAILAGDALLTLAFAIVTGKFTDDDPAVRCTIADALAHFAGAGGMVGGQTLDMAGGADMNEMAVRAMQAMKTGALFRFAAEAGAILGRASAADRARLARYGEALGIAFQVADDLIDATGDAAAAGKATAKDAAKGKATLVKLRGVDGARAALAQALDEAVAALEPFGARAAVLAETARFVAAQVS